jgi:hypothetical protein
LTVPPRVSRLSITAADTRSPVTDRAEGRAFPSYRMLHRAYDVLAAFTLRRIRELKQAHKMQQAI